MALYFPNQVLVSFAGEAGRGGYLETTAGGGAAVNTRNTVAVTTTYSLPPGSRSARVAEADIVGLSSGDYIQLETNNTSPHVEVRRIIGITNESSVDPLSNDTIWFDAPTGFPHPNVVALAEYNVITNGVTGTSLITFLPGVFSTINLPDLDPEFHFILSFNTDRLRNWEYTYRGQHVLTGSMDDIILLNGFPLRFGIGSIATVASALDASPTPILTQSADTRKGDREITVNSAVGLIVGDIIQVGTGTTAEVRRIAHINVDALRLNYPLFYIHDAVGMGAEAVRRVPSTAFYQHTIREESALDTMTWNVIFRDTGSTAANDFTRRYIGGIANRTTISAAEGGMARIGWDEIIFMDVVHNQAVHSSVSGDITKSTRALRNPTIGEDLSSSLGGATFAGIDTATTTYPTTEPYYFSQGTLTAFGISFARVRSFELTIDNNIKPHYCIRGLPAEREVFFYEEGRREYRLRATIAMEDSITATSNTRTLWKELILQGNYTAIGAVPTLTGISLQLLFIRGANDIIRVRSPIDQAPSSAFNDQGVFLIRAGHPLGGEFPTQVEIEMVLRNLEIYIEDRLPVYP